MADIFGTSNFKPTTQAPAFNNQIFGGTPIQQQVPATTSIFQDNNLAIDCSIIRGGSPGEYLFKAYFSN